jgi:chemotaxis response regulator CheB
LRFFNKQLRWSDPEIRAAIPALPDLAFVVVQHLMPDLPSQLATLLRRWTTLPVCNIAPGMRLESNRLYVAAPGQATSQRPAGTWPFAINSYLQL